MYFPLPKKGKDTILMHGRPNSFTRESTVLVNNVQAIQENPYMQYLLGLSKFTEKPVFVPELFVLIRKRLDQDFFNMLTLILSEADGSKPKKES